MPPRGIVISPVSVFNMPVPKSLAIASSAVNLKLDSLAASAIAHMDALITEARCLFVADGDVANFRDESLEKLNCLVDVSNCAVEPMANVLEKVLGSLFDLARASAAADAMICDGFPLDFVISWRSSDEDLVRLPEPAICKDFEAMQRMALYSRLST